MLMRFWIVKNLLKSVKPLKPIEYNTAAYLFIFAFAIIALFVAIYLYLFF